MRFEVSIILSATKQKERSDFNPKGIGHVASRPCVLEFVLFACGAAVVVGRYRLVGDSTAEGLHVEWHVGTGLPWNWRIGPADSSERAHWLEMLPTLPLGALMAVDAGFVGCEYTRAVVESLRHVLLRVGSNVRLCGTALYRRNHRNFDAIMGTPCSGSKTLAGQSPRQWHRI